MNVVSTTCHVVYTGDECPTLQIPDPNVPVNCHVSYTELITGILMAHNVK